MKKLKLVFRLENPETRDSVVEESQIVLEFDNLGDNRETLDIFEGAGILMSRRLMQEFKEVKVADVA